MRLLAVSFGVDPQPRHTTSCFRTIRPHVWHFIGAKTGVLTRSAPEICSKQHTPRTARIVGRNRLRARTGGFTSPPLVATDAPSIWRSGAALDRLRLVAG